jgi:dopamine beta-monooxygenase
MKRSRRAGVVALAAVLLTGGLTSTAEARRQRVAQVPNGEAFNCATCHVDPSGGRVRNAFGKTIESGFLTASDATGSVVWGPDLAELDADGDGFTNGEELGDPDGVWKPGYSNPGDPAALTNPGDAESHPAPPVSSAIAATTWARVKQLIEDLLP